MKVKMESRKIGSRGERNQALLINHGQVNLVFTIG
jgi:hypothetical protein